jgi:hypothetical protein
LTPWPRAASVAVERERLRVSLKDGREIVVPVDWFDFLMKATDEQRQRFRLDEHGAAISWDELEDGISVPSLFGLPEHPPRTRGDRYILRYRHDGRRWIADLPDFNSWTPARTLTAAKREGRGLLAMLLDVDDLDAAGINVIDEVDTLAGVRA